MQIFAGVGAGASAPTTAPTGLSAIASPNSVTISFTPPPFDGGSPITNYEYAVSANLGAYSSWTALSPADTTSPITIGSLIESSQYNIKLRAVNAIGASPESTPVNFFTPPVAPTGLIVTGGVGSLSIAFNQLNSGFYAIQNYEYSIETSPSGSFSTYTPFSPADATSPVVISGLLNSQTYYVKLRAVTSVATSEPSASASGTTLTPVSIQYLVLAGGGGGALDNGGGAGAGGGAGGYRSSVTGENSGGGSSAEATVQLIRGTTYTVTVGGGAARLPGGNGFGNNGSNSSLSGGTVSIASIGGGGGADSTTNDGRGIAVGRGGGSGGGNGAYYDASSTRSPREVGQGFQGGIGVNRLGSSPCAHPDYNGGGGGGAGGQGGDGSCGVGGAGGAGITSSITGSPVARGGGGGGGKRGGGTGGSASAGGGAGCSGTTTRGSDGTANTGGGGGGSGNDWKAEGTAGGSGVVVVRWLNTLPLASATTGSPTYTNTAGYHIYTFTGIGSITP